MNTKYILAIAAVLMAAPVSLASVPIYKDYCEDRTFDWPWHKYYGGTTVNIKVGDPIDTGITVVGDGNITGDCNGDTIPADYDGHLEYGVGGAILTVAAETVPGCAIEIPHHAGTIHVWDRVFGFGVTFTVGADSIDETDPTNPVPGCDSVTDDSVKCFGWCDPTFPPGADGAYWVFVHAPATKGCVHTNGAAATCATGP